MELPELDWNQYRQSGEVTFILGKRATGKTILAHECTRQWVPAKIVVFSSTPREWEIIDPTLKIHNQHELRLLFEMVRTQEEPDGPRLVIVLDQVGTSELRSSAVQYLFEHVRKLNISLVVITALIMQIPIECWEQVDYIMCLGSCGTPREVKRIYQEFVNPSVCSYETFAATWERCMRIRFQALVIDVSLVVLQAPRLSRVCAPPPSVRVVAVLQPMVATSPLESQLMTLVDEVATETTETCLLCPVCKTHLRRVVLGSCEACTLRMIQTHDHLCPECHASINRL